MAVIKKGKEPNIKEKINEDQCLKLLKQRYKGKKKLPENVAKLVKENPDIPVLQLNKYLQEKGEKKAAHYYIRNRILKGNDTDLMEFDYCMVSFDGIVSDTGGESFPYLMGSELCTVGDVVVTEFSLRGFILGKVEEVIHCFGVDAPYPVSKTKMILRKATQEEISAKRVFLEEAEQKRLPNISAVGTSSQKESRKFSNVYTVEKPSVENTLGKRREMFHRFSKEFDLTFNENGITIKKLRFPKKYIIIPAEIDGYKVTQIDAYAFAETPWDLDESRLEAIELPETIEKIGEGSFSGCAELITITLPKGVKEIAAGTFENCQKLETLVIPEGVVRIEDGALFGCGGLRQVYFPRSVEYISNWIFSKSGYRDQYLNKNTSFYVKKGSYSEFFLRTYKAYFCDCDDCDYLTVLYENQFLPIVPKNEDPIPEGLQYKIQPDATLEVFFKNQTAPNLRIPKTIRGMSVTKLTGLREIDRRIESIYVPSSVVSIEGLCRTSFVSSGDVDHSMREIQIAEDNPCYWSDGKALYTKDKSILIHMFDYQANEYRICDDTKVIGQEAFAGFKQLRKLILPEGLQEVHSEAFDGCTNLAEIVGIEKVPCVAEGSFWDTLFYHNNAVIFTGTVLQRCAMTKEKCFIIPEGTTEIAKFAFSVEDETDMLAEVVIPYSVHMIGEYAFKGRKKLSRINIPEGVKEIKDGTFADCGALTHLYIPASVTKIAVKAFHSSLVFLAAAYVPNFEVDADNAVYKSINGVLYSKDMTHLIRVPYGFSDIEFRVPGSVEVIEPFAFEHNFSIKKVFLPPSVSYISSSAFANSVALESINLENVKTICPSAFSECKCLRSVHLNTEEIGPYAFSSCQNLSNVVLHNTKVIDNGAFQNCKRITNIILPDGLYEIGHSAFANTGLEKVTIPKTVLKAGHESFSGCWEITIYDTIEPDAKPCEEHFDDLNGTPNATTGFIGIGGSLAQWTCVANHEWLDYEIIVRSAKTDEILYKVWMGADPDQRWYHCMLTSSWGKNATFNFAALDDAFSQMEDTNYREHKVKVAAYRLRYPEKLSEDHKEKYISYLRKRAEEFIDYCILNDDLEILQYCEQFGIITKRNIKKLLELVPTNVELQVSDYLMEYSRTHFGSLN